MVIHGHKINTGIVKSANSVSYLKINPINTMALGDTDQLLGAVSLSSGDISYISSNSSIGYIYKSGSNWYIRPISTGDFTITASQSLQGSYHITTNTKKCTIVSATTKIDTTFSTVTLGKAGTSNENYFNVNDTSGLTYRKYLMVSGSAIYQGTYPSTSNTTAAGVKTKIFNQDLGVMPQTPLVDIDSIWSLNHINRFKNIGGSTTLDNNFLQYFTWTPVTSSGSINVTRLNINEFQIDFVGASTVTYASFIALDHPFLPSGLWNFSADIRLLPGDSGKNCYCGIQFDSTSASYQTVALSTTNTTVNFGTTENSSDGLSSFYQFAIAASNVANVPTTLSIIVSNRRFTPGNASASATTASADPALVLSNRMIPSGANSDLSWKLKNLALADGVGNSLVSIGASINTYPITMLFAVKLANNGINNALIYSEGGTNGVYIDTNGSFFSQGNLMFGAGAVSYNLLDGNWVIMGVVVNAANNNCDTYINGFRVIRGYAGMGIAAFTNLFLMGNNSTSFKNDLSLSGATIWNTELSDTEIYDATMLLKERMRLKNHFIPESLTTSFFYIPEGDSITAVPQGGSLYSNLYRADYTPQLFGYMQAINGARLGNVGDNEVSVNTVLSRQARLITEINKAFSKGYTKVVVSVLIGANDIIYWTTLADVDTYYNKLAVWADAVMATGAKLAMCTMTDINNVAFGVTTDKTYLNYYNNKIRAMDGHKNVVIDFNADSAFSVATTTYYNSDLVHPKDVGQARMHTIAKPILDSLFNS